MVIDSCNGKKLTTAGEIADMMRGILDLSDEYDKTREHFWVIGFNVELRVMYVECVSIGNMESSIVDPREVFRAAIIKHADRIVVIHNHPSGTLLPSDADLEVTQRLVKSGRILNLEVIDHIIITRTGFYSMREKRVL